MKVVTSKSSLLLLNVYIFIDNYKYDCTKNKIVFSSFSYANKSAPHDLRFYISFRGEYDAINLFA